MEAQKTERRSLKYIRLAAFLAGQSVATERIVLTLPQVEEIVGDSLPREARWSSWWRNDERKMHSRAWLTAGWRVGQMAGEPAEVEFLRVKG